MNAETTGLIVIDAQERLFAAIPNREIVARRMALAIRCAHLLDLPIVVSEQYPKGLGATLPQLREALPEGQDVAEKLCFSCYRDSNLRARIDALPGRTWLLVGMEAHVCISQTVKDLLAAGKKVVVLGDAVASRREFDCQLALDELRHEGVGVKSVEGLFFELLGSAEHKQFKALHALMVEG